MEQEQVIQRIKELGEKILPESASSWLYGPQGGDKIGGESQWELFITEALRKKQKQTEIISVILPSFLPFSVIKHSGPRMVDVSPLRGSELV